MAALKEGDIVEPVPVRWKGIRLDARGVVTKVYRTGCEVKMLDPMFEERNGEKYVEAGFVWHLDIDDWCLAKSNFLMSRSLL